MNDTSLQLIQLRENASNQLAQIKDIETGVNFLDKIKALETYAKATKQDSEIVKQVQEQKIRSMRILGKLLQETEFESGARGVPGNQYTLVELPKETPPKPRLSDFGISRKESHTYQTIAAIPAPEFEKQIEEVQSNDSTVKELTVSSFYNTGKTIKRREEQDALREELNDTVVLDTGVYDLIYCDPPWRYDFSSTSNRDIENHYPTMSIDDLMQMEIPAADNCVLYMWATSPKLVEAINLINSWGFTYKTHAIWDKEKIGMGYWFRGQHELLMVATKGSVSPPMPDQRKSSVIKEPRSAHSKKPDIVYEWLEEWFPGSSKIELFARNTRDGWQSWGNQI